MLATMARPRPEPVVIRLAVFIRVYSAGFAVLWFGFLIFFLSRSTLADVPVAIAMMGLGGAMMFRLNSLRVVADESGLIVCNVFRTWRFSWDEVEDFRLGRPTMGMPFGKVIHVLLRNDEVITADVTAMSWFFLGRVKQQQALQKLRAWVRSKR
jgi:Bacterial PH domain